MLLKLNRLFRRARRDEGSALIPVLGIVALGLIVTGTLATSIVNGFTLSSATRASVQSQAAADAGVAAARAGLYAGNCTLQTVPGVYSSTGSIYYSAQVQTLVSGNWTNGCPANLTAQVKILSTGRATRSAGVPYGTATKVEAIYNFLWPGVTPTGVAMYLYSGGTVSANSSLDLSESPIAGLVIKKGNFTCAKNNTVINGNVVITGNLNFGSNSCSINGNAWVSGSVTLGSKGSITGNLTAGSVSPNPPKKQVGGTYTQGGTMPSSAPWTDVPYAPSSWVDSTGLAYQIITLSGATCTQTGGNFGGFAGRATIVNAMACPNGILVSNNTNFKLTSDVVIFAPQFAWGSINSLTFSSSDTTEHRLWFITPDSTADAQPTCATGESDFAINNSFAINSPIDAMLYTPCAFNGKNGFTWRGQVYAGNVSDVENNPSFTFIPIGIAGYDLGSGQTITTVGTPQPGSLISNRNVVS